MSVSGIRLGFCGAGKMAQALARGIIAAGTLSPSDMIASSPVTDKVLLDQIGEMGVKTTTQNAEVISKSDVIFLAVKPQNLKTVAAEIAPGVDRSKLIISIAMGINIRSIERLLPAKSRIARVMPNTPAVVRSGSAGFSLGGACLEGDSDMVNKLMSSVGYCVELKECLLDAVTGVSGSGVAYFYIAIEALTDAAVKQGIPRDLAKKIAAHTVLGAAKMVLETDDHPGKLKDDVQSPAGSTCFGTNVLETAGFRGIIINAVEAATKRSKETGASNGGNTGGPKL